MFGREPKRVHRLAKGELLIFELQGVTYAASWGLGRDFDLILTRKGKLPEPEVVALFEQLLKSTLKPGQLLKGVSIPGYTQTAAWLREDRFHNPFAGLKPAREFFAVLPLFDGEVAEIEKKGLAALADTFVSVKWDEPKRNPFAGPAPKRKPAPTGKGIWDRLLAHLREKDALEFDRLMEGKGASAAAIAAVKKARPRVHASVLELLKRFDGRASLFEYTTLTAKQVVSRAKSLDSLVRQKKARFSPDYTPFAEDGGGNLFCATSKGQIVQWEIRGHDTFRRATSMKALVEAHLRGETS